MPKHEIIPSVEIFGAMGTHSLSKDQIAKFKADTKSFLLAETNLELTDDMHIHVVDNLAGEVHLALPYYEKLQHNNIQKLSDDDLNEVAGGEFIAGYVISAIVLSIAVSAAIGGTITAVENKQIEAEQENLRREEQGLPPIEGK